MVDYEFLLERTRAQDEPTIVPSLMDELTYEWREEYVRMTPHPTNLLRLTHDGFEFIFDNYSALEATDTAATRPC